MGKYRKYCSRQCANSRVFTKESNRLKSEKMKGYRYGNAAITTSFTKICTECGEPFKCFPYNSHKEMCTICAKPNGRWSDIMKQRFSEAKQLYYHNHPEKHPNRLCAGIKESYPEQMMREYLEQNGLVKDINFIQQYSIDKYYVDFYIPKLRLGIEIDGRYWHTDHNKEHIREQIIKNQIDLIRFDAVQLIDKQYQSEIDKIINAVIA